MLGTALLLLAVAEQRERQARWDNIPVAYPKAKWRDVLGAALAVTAVLVFISAFTASASIRRIQDWLAEQQRPAVQHESDLAKSLGLLPNASKVPDAFKTARSPSLPRQVLIGSGPELSHRVVMSIAATEPAGAGGTGSVPFYWRSFTYDLYTGNGWSSSPTQENLYQAGEPISAARRLDEGELQQEVFPVEDLGGTVYAAGEPISVNQPAQAAWRSPGDLFGVHIDGLDSYDVVSSTAVATVIDLQSAGQSYPDWVRSRFLSLPGEIPDRVRALAARLTASQSTPYDRARAIEAYLRQYPYTLDVTRPPAGQDVVDYFLFDLKKGYCDYYASAMVVLARASGVPARLAVGYSAGAYNLNSKRYIVTEADAHSWVEVYFPRIGWVPFEPTAARPELQWAETAPRAAPVAPSLPQTRTPAGSAAMLRSKSILLAGVVLVILLAAWAAAREARLRALAPREAASEAYQRMQRMGARLRTPSERGDTPYEFSTALTSRIREMGAGGPGHGLALRAIGEVDKIAEAIVNANYSPGPDPDLHIWPRWEGLRWQLGLIWMWHEIRSAVYRLAGTTQARREREEN
jgi:transglutaminase-like putative cysteine protease